MFRSQYAVKAASRCSNEGKSIFGKVGQTLSNVAKSEGATGLDKAVAEKLTIFRVGSSIFTAYCLFQGLNIVLFNKWHMKN